MNKQVIVAIILILFGQNNFAQTLLKGKIICEASNLEGINIINLNNYKNTTTLQFGYFTIEAKVNDTLLISGLQIMGARIILKESDFSKNLFFVRLKPKINELEEVVIRNEITAVSLGIIPKGVKTYTPAERRLKNAGEFKPTFILGVLGGAMPIEPIINAISGRTKMLRKELKVERNEIALAALNTLYEDNYYVDNLKIPSNYVNGFKYFVIDDKKLVASLHSKNNTLTTFILGELAEKYKSVTFPSKE
jgi:hypothetical protein